MRDLVIKNEKNPEKNPNLFVDGPFGEAHQDYSNYEAGFSYLHRGRSSDFCHRWLEPIPVICNPNHYYKAPTLSKPGRHFGGRGYWSDTVCVHFKRSCTQSSIGATLACKCEEGLFPVVDKYPKTV